jgi:hypothetical protein
MSRVEVATFFQRSLPWQVVNERPTWKLNVTEPVAGNYYPVRTRRNQVSYPLGMVCRAHVLWLQSAVVSSLLLCSSCFSSALIYRRSKGHGEHMFSGPRGCLSSAGHRRLQSADGLPLSDALGLPPGR